MSKNTWTATSAALAAVWARRATDPVTPAATPSPSVSAQFTTKETSTLRRVVPLLVVSAIPGTRSVLLGLQQRRYCRGDRDLKHRRCVPLSGGGGFGSQHLDAFGPC